VHLLKISLHDWFNHKDLAHIFIILSLILIGRGVVINGRILQSRLATA
jgi:hypothetical protein